MNHWHFIIAAYAITLGGAALTSLWAWHSARSAEARADALLRDRD